MHSGALHTCCPRGLCGLSLRDLLWVGGHVVRGCEGLSGLGAQAMGWGGLLSARALTTEGTLVLPNCSISGPGAPGSENVLVTLAK